MSDTKDYRDTIQEILEIARGLGLDPPKTVFEFVPFDTMNQLIAYGGLYKRMHHWSFGAAYHYQKMYGQMGFSKVFEIIIDHDPSYAYLLDTNRDIENKLVIAHCFGHSHLFKNNIMFIDTNKKMISESAKHNELVKEYIEEFGEDEVEKWIDIAFSIDRHIDYHKGLYRNRYPKRKLTEKSVKIDEFDDITEKEPKFSRKMVVEGDKLPPYPENDFLWFFTNYAPIEEWQKNLFMMIREESFYFYPSFCSNIVHEGFASFCHSRIMNEYNLTFEEQVEFSKLHSSVVHPGSPFNINRYYLGYKIFEEIEKTWNEKYKNGESTITGMQKVIEVANNENDVSFLRSYLSKDLIKEMNLFTYGRAAGYKCKDCKSHSGNCKCDDHEPSDIVVTSKQQRQIIETMSFPKYNYGVPLIQIISVGPNKELILKSANDLCLEQKYCTKTLKYLFEIWKNPIYLLYKDGQKRMCFSVDSDGDVDKEDDWDIFNSEIDEEDGVGNDNLLSLDGFFDDE